MRRWLSRTGLLVAALVLGFSTLLATCGYIALPGGLVINFPSFPGSQTEPMTEEQLRSRLELPDGFSIETWATGMPNARLLMTTEAGDLLVTAPREGKIFLVRRDENGDGRADGVEVLFDDLDRPHGVDWKDGSLYIAEGTAIARVSFDPATRKVGDDITRIVTGLPDGGNHWTRTVHIGPDGKLYVAVGSSCNVCEEDDPRRAALVRYDLDGSNEELYATGLRNTVDFAWRPGTKELYGTDNGRDLLGDDYPPEEINLIREGGFYGWPYANPPRKPDPDFGDVRPDKVAISIPPAHDLPAHTAPLGIGFYEGTMFPEKYRGAAFVALHGSWNRREKQGYEVVTLFFAPDGSIQREPFLRNFEVDEDVTGRPVGIATGPDGALYVSDDYTGSVYRIAFGEKPRSETGSIPQPKAETDSNSAPAPAAPASTEAGKLLWEGSDCARCHVTGEANAPPQPLTKLGQKYDVPSLAKFLASPQPPMPLYPFDEQQRRDLAAYLLKRFP